MTTVKSTLIGKGLRDTECNTSCEISLMRITGITLFCGHITELRVSKKKCQLTKLCGCWIYSQSIACSAVVVGQCSLHFWNIQVLLITRNMWWITRTPRNCWFWVSFHLAEKWCSLFSANKEFLSKCNLGRNYKELKKKKQKKIQLL